mgnify:CR=1 FL=1
MCMSVLSIISTAFSVIGQLSQGSQQQDWAEYQAEQARADAQAAREEGQVRAEKVRKLGKRQQSEARAALAASGVETSAGSAVVIDRQIGRDAEEDAQQEIIAGQRRGQRYDQEASASTIRGENAMNRSLLAAGGSLASGWRPSSLRINYDDSTNYRDS